MREVDRIKILNDNEPTIFKITCNDCLRDSTVFFHSQESDICTCCDNIFVSRKIDKEIIICKK